MGGASYGIAADGFADGCLRRLHGRRNVLNDGIGRVRHAGLLCHQLEPAEDTAAADECDCDRLISQENSLCRSSWQVFLQCNGGAYHVRAAISPG